MKSRLRGSAPRRGPKIAGPFLRIVSREVTGGYQKAEPITVRFGPSRPRAARCGRHGSVGPYYPFREANTAGDARFGAALLPAEFRKAAIASATDNREVSS